MEPPKLRKPLLSNAILSAALSVVITVVLTLAFKVVWERSGLSTYTWGYFVVISLVAILIGTVSVWVLYRPQAYKGAPVDEVANWLKDKGYNVEYSALSSGGKWFYLEDDAVQVLLTDGGHVVLSNMGNGFVSLTKAVDADGNVTVDSEADAAVDNGVDNSEHSPNISVDTPNEEENIDSDPNDPAVSERVS